MKSYFGKNVKHLRTLAGLSQDQLAKNLNITRSKLNSYENELAINPPIGFLFELSKYFELSIEMLITSNLEHFANSKLAQIQSDFASGKLIRVLATTIDATNKENIELVPLKAKAGYLAGYDDPQFIASLPTFQLPFLSREKKFRAFQIEGDSMLPIKSGSYVVGEYVVNWHDIKNNHAYVLLTENDGAVFKIVFNQIEKTGKLLLKSLNPAFEPYETSIREVKEVWKFINYFSSELPEPIGTNDQILQRLTEVEKRINQIQH